MSVISVLLLGDRRASLEATALALSGGGSLKVVGIETGPERFWAAGRKCNADVAIIEAPCVDADTLREFVQVCPETRVLIIGDPGEDLLALLVSGASGFVGCDTALGELEVAVKALVADGLLLPPALAALAIGRLRDYEDMYGAHGMDMPKLGVREAEVLRMLATGATNREIAARAGVSVSTVKNQVAAVFRKLGVSSRSEAVASAFRLGLLAEHVPADKRRP